MATADVRIPAKLRCAVEHAGLSADQQIPDAVQAQGRFDYIVPLPAEPLGQTAAGTSIDQEFHRLAISTRSSESSATTA